MLGILIHHRNESSKRIVERARRTLSLSLAFFTLSGRFLVAKSLRAYYTLELNLSAVIETYWGFGLSARTEEPDFIEPHISKHGLLNFLKNVQPLFSWWIRNPNETAFFI